MAQLDLPARHLYAKRNVKSRCYKESISLAEKRFQK